MSTAWTRYIRVTWKVRRATSSSEFHTEIDDSLNRGRGGPRTRGIVTYESPDGIQRRTQSRTDTGQGEVPRYRTDRTVGIPTKEMYARETVQSTPERQREVSTNLESLEAVRRVNTTQWRRKVF